MKQKVERLFSFNKQMITKERLEGALGRRKGFTLIEILIVVAIIAILASVVLVGLGPTQQSGRDARRLSDLHEVQNSLELYYNSCGYYPGTDTATPCDGYAASTGYAGGANPVMATITGFNALGVNTMPDDPTAGHHYLYYTESDGSSYVLAANLENANNSVFGGGYAAPSNLISYTDGDDTTNFTCASPQYCISL